MKTSRFKIQNLFIFFCALSILFVSACNLPNLQDPECTAARQTLKEFYSFHFGNDMKFSAENLKIREKFLTPEYAKTLENAPPENDVFTVNSTDYPKAFRIGKCEKLSPDKTVFEILLFWKDDNRNEEREIKVEVAKQNDQWLVNKVNY